MSGYQALTEMIRRQVFKAVNAIAKPRYGTITSYNPKTYSVKVMLQPEGFESGWIPLGSSAAGAGWGVYHAPVVGQMVGVEFANGDINSGRVTGSYSNDVDRPPMPVPPGEMLMQHKSGSLLHFDTAGNVTVVAKGNLNYTVSGDANLTVTGNANLKAAQWNFQGKIVSQDDVVAGSISAEHHTHPDAQGGNTGAPQ